MDRNINYAGQVPLETDLLKSNQFAMVGIAKLAAAMFGATNGFANGFATTQTTVPSLAVTVAPGELYQLVNLENTAYSSLAADTTHQIVKQGIALNSQNLTITPPGTAGFSINYLIQATYQDSDTGSTVLPYYNASNPSVAYSGPANSGTAQPTTRSGSVVVSAKAGTAATTGTQTTPAPDAGYVGLYVVTVANGASTVVNANISAYPNAPILATPVTSGRLIGLRVFTSTQTYTPTAGTNSVEVLVQAGGGGGGAAQVTGAGQIAAGAGGGGGGWARKRITSNFSGVTITVGAAGGAGNGGAGSAGGSSSFGALVSATGGGGGSFGSTATSGTVSIQGVGAAGAGSNGDINANGGVGQYAVYNGTSPTSGQGGGSFFGGGAGWVTSSTLAAGLSLGSPFYGTGGSGSASGPSQGGGLGGAGVQGAVLVWEYA